MSQIGFIEEEVHFGNAFLQRANLPNGSDVNLCNLRLATKIGFEAGKASCCSKQKGSRDGPKIGFEIKVFVCFSGLEYFWNSERFKRKGRIKMGLI